ncbi:hypothetical protein BHE74_00004622 [Ensete ventricosum]|uniref:Uncharacterized protein n=1 Tax=Ensete ventricosum TaxID=4639 RepID=A0A427B6U8_ENSVE|nr:hypothetical protein B296_00003933 [Ensete ventricosum]RWW34221.1 hypothetical protein GW17_00001027 [Ensete ventricosum]RWW86594.1 hypothetical protein BHE74_00004622 [Ensete ventricosum]RZR72013.1 hypothetical protein BHM03_00009483 [Ensete ventricosum]
MLYAYVPFTRNDAFLIRAMPPCVVPPLQQRLTASRKESARGSIDRVLRPRSLCRSPSPKIEYMDEAAVRVIDSVSTFLLLFPSFPDPSLLGLLI